MPRAKSRKRRAKSRRRGKSWKRAPRLKRLVGPNNFNRRIESRFWDTFNGTTVMDNATGTIIPLTNVPQGTTAFSRSGNQIRCLRLHLNMMFLMASNQNSYAGAAFVVYLVLDRNPAGAAPIMIGSQTAILSLLSNTDTSDLVMAPRNVSTIDKFIVLKKWHRKLGQINNTATSATATPPNTVHILRSFNLRGLRSTFMSTSTGATTTFETNHLFLMIGLSAECTNNSVSSKIHARLRFI